MDYRIQLDRHGRFLIPANLRKNLNYNAGDHFVLRSVNDEIHILKMNQIVKETHELISQYFQPGEPLLEEFLQMRKDEFIKEENIQGNSNE